MPQLHVKDVREAMRRAFDMSPEERYAKTDGAQISARPLRCSPHDDKCDKFGMGIQGVADKGNFLSLRE